jgi:hypothetical protein
LNPQKKLKKIRKKGNQENPRKIEKGTDSADQELKNRRRRKVQSNFSDTMLIVAQESTKQK